MRKLKIGDKVRIIDIGPGDAYYKRPEFIGITGYVRGDIETKGSGYCSVELKNVVLRDGRLVENMYFIRASVKILNEIRRNPNNI